MTFIKNIQGARITGSITASFAGDGAGLTGIISASNADTASYVDLVAGTNITINQTGTTYTINSTGGGGSAFPYTGSAIISGSLEVTGSVNISGSLIASGLAYPTADQEPGDVLTTDGLGNLSFNKPTVYAKVKNITAGTLPKGMPVHVTSSVGNVNEVVVASASNAATMPATFILAEQLTAGQEGLGIVTGFINGVNTSAFTEGDIVYVAAAGGYTNVKPTGSNLIQNIGIVTKIDASNGSGFIYGSGRSNDVPNITEGYTWVGNSNGVATPTATSSIQNVISSSFAATASYAGLYSGNGTIPLNTTASVNGDLLFQGLDEDTKLIVRDGNNGSSIELFSDGNAGQASIRFVSPSNQLVHQIQQAGGETRYISDNRDLVFTTSTSSLTQGIVVQAGTGNVGIGTDTPTRRFEVVTGSNTAYFDLTNTNGPLAAVVTSDLTKLARFNASNGSVSVSVGIRSLNETANPGFGAPNDAYIQANSNANGLNIFNSVGIGTEDYIRLYAGEPVNTSTAHIHIQGSGSTKGFIGIGTETPNARLDVNGNALITGSLTVSGSSRVIGTLNADGVQNIRQYNVNGNWFQGSLSVGKTGTANKTLDVSGSAIITGSLNVTQGITGSLLGTASYATAAVTAISASTVFIDYGYNIDTEYPVLFSILSASYAAPATDTNISYNTFRDRLTVTNISSSTITGSLFGTASWAQNSVTASFITTAQTASYVLNAVSASYADNVLFQPGSSGTASTIRRNASNTATANYSLAIGLSNAASGIGSVAIGTANTASGDRAVALGRENIASGDRSFVSGYLNISSGSQSFAHGFLNTASNSYSVAIGRENISSNTYSVAIGRENISSNIYSVAIGSENTASNSYSVAIGSANSSTATNSMALGLSNTVSGVYGFAAGRTNVVTSINGIAMGRQNTVSNAYGFAVGYSNVISAEYGGAIGFGNTILSTYGIAVGRENQAGNHAFAAGYNNRANTISSFAIGQDNVVTGNNAGAVGYQNSASGDYSYAQGYQTTAFGTYSHAEGALTTANGSVSHAEGSTTTASGDWSHSEGDKTFASASTSHAQGYKTITTGYAAHAGGTESEARGISSFIHSSASLVTGNYSAVLGGRNITGSLDNTVYVPNLHVTGSITAPGIANAETSQVVYYNTSSGAMTYGEKRPVGNAQVDNFYYSISNSADTRPIFEDTDVLFNWDETGNQLEFQMKVAPGGSGDMRSLGYIVGGSTQNTAIVATGVNYDVYAAGVSAGNRLEVFITAENDVTYPAYHVTAYNTGESFHNTIWIQRITRI